MKHVKTLKQAAEIIDKYNLRPLTIKQLFKLIWWYYFNEEKVKTFAYFLDVGMSMYYAYKYADQK